MTGEEGRQVFESMLSQEEIDHAEREAMTGEEGRQVFESMLSQEEIDHLCQQCGVIDRQRIRHLGMLVRAMVISAGTPGGAYQADVLRS